MVAPHEISLATALLVTSAQTLHEFVKLGAYCNNRSLDREPRRLVNTAYENHSRELPAKAYQSGNDLR